MINVKQPANKSLIPDKIFWIEPSDIELQVLNEFFMRGKVIQKRSTNPAQALLGYYKISSESNYFAKIVSSKTHKSLRAAEKISKWISSAGVSTNFVHTDYPKKIKKTDFWLYLYKYIEHDFSIRGSSELNLLGNRVGAMHYLMKSHPLVKQVRANGEKNNKYLLTQLNKINSGQVSSSLPSKALTILKNITNSDFLKLTENAQMIHGDLNVGNIIFNKDESDIVFIDFEDSASSWLSPIYDIAFIFQRFVLIDQIENKINLALSFITGYQSQNKIKVPYGTLFCILKMISIRSLLILSTLEKKEQELYKNEINKFITLHDRAENDISLIYEIEKLF